MSTRTVEQLAPETLAELLPDLTKLTAKQPTTEELEAALHASKAITRALFEWLANRYTAQAAAKRALGVPVETPYEREELDRIEAANPVVLGRLA